MRYLVVMDHTLGGTGLSWAVREHAFEEGEIEVDVIVPTAESETDSAQRRLESELQTLRSARIAANGSIVVDDPYKAICDAAGNCDYAGVIIATHSPTISRWMHLDLPRRVESKLQVPVEWIDAETDDPSEHTEIRIELPRAAMRTLEKSDQTPFW